MALIQGTAHKGSVSGFYNFPLEQSLRFNDDDTAYLSWTPASASDQDKWTWSGWVKRADINTESYLFSAGTSSTELFYIQMRSDSSSNVITIVWRDGSTTTRSLVTDRVFRDPSAWYHIVLSVDTANATTAHKMRLYINSVEITDFSADSRSTLSASSSLPVNSADLHTLGRYAFAASGYLDGYLAEVNFIDGTALDADSFGELKSGVWIPKDPTGLTYGTNGFRLSFADDAEVEAFNTVLYRGTGATQSITGMGFQPDLVWIKNRDSVQHNNLFDSLRGAGKLLYSNLTNAEATSSTHLNSFDSDGFTVGSAASANGSGNGIVAWGWKAGDSNVSNTNGTITSTVRANDTYGFSIVTWDAPASGATTVGHGLSSAPDFVICKIRNVATNWQTWHTGLSGGTYTLFLNGTGAEQVQADAFGAVPTSSVLNIGSDFSGSGRQNIAYCWAEKAGYSKFGSYSGGTANYKVTTDFRPSLVLVKRTDSTSDWQMFDGTRDVSNPVTARLNPNQSYAELTNGNFDILDDGFELNDTSAGWNASGGTYIYAAFADTREAAFWLDQSGNDNDWQPVNLNHNDTVADSPTNNFCTLNPLELNYVTLSDGNLVVQESAGSWRSIRANFMMPTGQWYWEFEGTASASQYFGGGVSRLSEPLNNYVGQTTDGYGTLGFNGNKYNGAAYTFSSTYAVGDVIGVAFDADAGTLDYYKNGTHLGTAFTGLTSGDFFPAFTVRSSTVKVNFGQQPFKYTPPE